tara:strand:- start:716 stop:994 length:279 start_codon:yes stop_codon:yes gene_type:complete
MFSPFVSGTGIIKPCRKILVKWLYNLFSHVLYSFPMNTKHLEKHWGSREQAQKVIGISRQLFNHWQAGKIPPMRQYQIEVITGGKLKADRSK